MTNWKLDPLTFDQERVLQFGGGNFLRGFFNWMLAVVNEEDDKATTVLVKPTRGGTYDTIKSQKGRFHTVLSGSRADGGYEVSVIDNISTVINPYLDFQGFLQTAKHPGIDVIVSNTTESGIRFVPEERGDDKCAEEFPGKLAQWLFQRFQELPHVKTLILPTELISNNGDVLLYTVQQYAQHWQLGSTFSNWLSSNNIFCNTLVDRIVSGRPSSDVRAKIQAQLSFEDELAVVGESYHHWVIQTNQPIKKYFPFDHPQLNIDIVSDLTLHREMKVKILNGLHTMMVPLGLMSGCQTVADVMAHQELLSLLTNTLKKEILPTINSPDRAKDSYAEKILARFRNPTINHLLASIALNALDKFKVRLMPTVLDYWHKTGKLPQGIMRSWAALLIFYSGKWNGKTLPVNDRPPIMDQLQSSWQDFTEQKIPLEKVVEKVIKDQALCPEELASIPKIVHSLCNEIQEIRSTGLLY